MILFNRHIQELCVSYFFKNLVSLISAIVMFLLLMNEYWNYRKYNLTTLMYVNKDRGSDKVPVNINIAFHNLPCELLSIEIKNNLGLNVQNIEGNLTKYSLDKNSKVIGEKPYSLESLGRFGHDHDHIAQPDYELVKKQINEKQGCKLRGSFFVDAVPGSFTISPKAFAPTLERLRREGLDNNINVEHSINDLFFGEEISFIRLLGFGFAANSLMHSLKGKKSVNEKMMKVYQYYLKIVPTKYRYYNGMTLDSYQYTVNSFSENSYDRFPLLFFRYDLSPITVEYKHVKMSFLTFMINVFAILGGVFTVAGIIDAIIHKSVLLLLRKAEMNKIA